MRRHDMQELPKDFIQAITKTVEESVWWGITPEETIETVREMVPYYLDASVDVDLQAVDRLVLAVYSGEVECWGAD